MPKLYTCSACSSELEASQFSKIQLRKGVAKRCTTCVQATLSSAHPAPVASESGASVATPRLLAHELAVE